MAKGTITVLGISLGVVLGALVVAGLLVDSADVAGAVGAVATAVGTLAGLALGKSAGESGKAEAMAGQAKFEILLEDAHPLTQDQKKLLRAADARYHVKKDAA